MLDDGIDLSFLAGRTVGVMGLGQSGLPAARALMAGGAAVWAWDDDADRRAPAREAGVVLVDLGTIDLKAIDLLVLSPGIPYEHPTPHPVAAGAKAAGAPILCDVALLLRARPDARFVGITGTNGKSTTTALIGHILMAVDREVAIGGNLGIAALALPVVPHGGAYVLELSSYQLELLPEPRFTVAVLLNISPDHLDRHDGLAGYVAAKTRVFDNQDGSATAVIGVDDAPSREVLDHLLSRNAQSIVPISGERVVPGGVYADSGWLVDDTAGDAQRMVALAQLPALPGSHNAQNAAGAYAAARALGVSSEIIVERLASYAGLAHRQEPVARIGNVLFVNDSKATNAVAAARALSSYDAIYWIAGGQAKDGGLDALTPYLDRVRHAYLIGEAAPLFASLLGSRIPKSLPGDLNSAVTAAAAQARQDDVDDAVVLLSPACASFDQFDNFAARGDAFRDAVSMLPGAEEQATA